jgi:hypothetical protein
MVLKLDQEAALTEAGMNDLVKKYWKLAVITLEEDERLNKNFRSKLFDSHDERWLAADIEFEVFK